jgi:hypothetical protein
MQLNNKYLYDEITQRPWAETNIDVCTSRFTPRIKKAVAMVLRGERIAPNSGDTNIVSRMLAGAFDLPTFCIQANKDGSVRVYYHHLNPDARKYLTPHYQTERVAIRLNGDEHCMLDLPWSSFHTDIPPKMFNGTYQYTRPTDALIEARRLQLEPKRNEIEQAIELLNSGKTFNVIYHSDTFHILDLT